MPTLAINKRAHFDYEILDKYEAGLVLTGPEVKSIRTGHISLKGSFVAKKGLELYLINASIPLYKFASKIKDYDATRSRKILLKKSELKSLVGKVAIQGLTLVPIRVYTKKRLLKLEFGVCKGKKEYDKRSDIAKHEAKRKIERTLKNY